MDSGFPKTTPDPFRRNLLSLVKRGHERISRDQPAIRRSRGSVDEWFERNRAVHESEVRAAASLLPRHDLEIEIRERFGGHRGAVALAVSILVDVNALAGIEVMTKWQ
jgi:hypothetical protein